MNKLDFLFLVILVIGAVSGYRQGFLMSLFSLLALILGILGGFKLMGTAMIALSSHYDIDNKVLPYVAFALVFVIIVIVVSLIGKSLSASLEKSVLGPVDSWMGAVLGVVKTVFMVSVLLWISQSMAVELPETWTDDSVFYSVISDFAPTIGDWVGDFIPMFHDLFEDPS